MSEKITFATFDPMRFDPPSHCDICASNPSVLHYEYSVDEGARLSPKRGFCCSSCATRLLEKLQSAESQAWAEEEASLRAEEFDVADLEERRLAIFGELRRS
jgi:hypothetical protein